MPYTANNGQGRKKHQGEETYASSPFLASLRRDISGNSTSQRSAFLDRINGTSASERFASLYPSGSTVRLLGE